MNSIHPLSVETITNYLKNDKDNILILGKDEQGRKYLQLQKRNCWAWLMIRIGVADYQFSNVVKYIEQNQYGEGIDTAKDFYTLLDRKIIHYDAKRSQKERINPFFRINFWLPTEDLIDHCMKGFNSCKTEAENGNSIAQYHLGMMYATGRGTPQNFNEAVKFFELSAAQGNTDAHYMLGTMYRHGNGVEQDFSKAKKHYIDAADHPKALTNLGFMYDEGLGGVKSSSNALALYRKAFERGDAVAQFNLGLKSEYGLDGVEKNLDMARQYYELAAEQNCAPAQNALGVMYEYGIGVEVDIDMALNFYTLAAVQENVDGLYNIGRHLEKEEDFASALNHYARAASFPNLHPQTLNQIGKFHEYGKVYEVDTESALYSYEIAADLGYAPAQFNLAMMYKFEKGIKNDPTKVIEYLTKAAEQGYAKAQASLGLCYYEIEYQKAIHWYTLAAEQNESLAQINLGLMYELGRGVDIDLKKTIELYSLAAEQGKAQGQYNMGLMYEEGKGVGKDMVKALEFFNLAADQGLEKAKNKLAKLQEVSLESIEVFCP